MICVGGGHNILEGLRRLGDPCRSGSAKFQILGRETPDTLDSRFN